MKWIDLLSLIFYNLGRRKGRVALTAMGVVIGTAAVVLLVSLANGLQRSTTSQFANIGDLTTIEVMPKYGESVQMGGGMMAIEKGGSSKKVKKITHTIIEEFKTIPGVQSVIIKESFQGSGVLKLGRLETYANMTGVDISDLSAFGYKLKEGTTQLEKGTVILGEPILKNFMDPKMRPGAAMPQITSADILGQSIKLEITKSTNNEQPVRKVVQLRVVGILAESRSESDYMVYARLDDVISWNDWANGKRVNRNLEGYQNVSVKVSAMEQALDITKQINQMGFMAYTPAQFIQSLKSTGLILQLVFGGVGAVALLVAAIGIANTMTMAILERTREIGLMKAVGASNRNVLSIFLGESAGIGFIGGIGGVLIGWGGGYIANNILVTVMASQSSGGMPPTELIYTPLWLPIFALIFATTVGLLSGLYPALRAASLVPVVALKYE